MFMRRVGLAVVIATAAGGLTGCAGVGEGLVASVTNSDGLYKDKSIIQNYLTMNCVLDLAEGGMSQCTKGNPTAQATFGGGYLGGQRSVQTALYAQEPVKNKYLAFTQAKCNSKAMIGQGEPIALDNSSNVEECQTGFLSLWKKEWEDCQKAPTPECRAEPSYGEFRGHLDKAANSFKAANYLQVRAMTGAFILTRQMKTADVRKEFAVLLTGSGDAVQTKLGMVAEFPLKATKILTNIATGITAYGEHMDVSTGDKFTGQMNEAVNAPIEKIQVSSAKPGSATDDAVLGGYIANDSPPAGYGMPPDEQVATASCPVRSLASKDDIITVQKRLKALGHLKANADGKWGDGSRNALRAFKKSGGLTADDVWDEPTCNKLISADTAQAKKVM